MKVKLTLHEKRALFNAVAIRKKNHSESDIISKKHKEALKKVDDSLMNQPFIIEGFAKALFKGLINSEIKNLLSNYQLEYLAPIEIDRLFVLADTHKFRRGLWNKLEKEVPKSLF
ncbi:hypothetical protein MWU59_02665 [Flavobacteriaceae bacterium F08102]|nr:hypothetical protein [Flavobacteriaceae bacterium F08102]